MENIYAVFVLRQDYDIEIGTVFNITYISQNNIATENNYELVAITQQWDKPFDRIPRGWKTICALKLINNIPSILTTLPSVDDWYASNYKLTLIEKFTQ